MLTQTMRGDDGSLTLLVIGYAALLALLIVIGVDVSKVFLARRALSSAADAAALTAAQSVDRQALYDGTAGGCGGLLPLDPDGAAQSVALTIEDDLADLRHTFATVDPPGVEVSGGSVTVHLSGDVGVPFGRALSLLLPGHDDGRVHVDVTSTAQSPVTSPGGC